MPIDQRCPAEPSTTPSRSMPRTPQRLMRPLVLAALVAAPVLCAGGASAMSLRGGYHATFTNHVTTYRAPSRASRVGVTTDKVHGISRRIGIVRPPVTGTGEGSHRPRWPHPTTIVRIPHEQSIPVDLVNLPPSGPVGPSGIAAPAAGSGAPIGVAAAVDRSYVPDEVLVRFAANLPPQTIVGIAQGQRLALLGIHRLPLINTVLYRFRITDRRDVPTVLGSLQGDARIAASQPNFYYVTHQADVSSVVIGDPAQYMVSKLHLPQAHRLATGDRVLIALIDSAVDVRHPELQGVIAGGIDTIKSEVVPDKHGTAMASAIAAHGRLMGVAPSAHILAVRAFEPAGTTARGTTARILEGLQWTATSGARVVNMSFAGPADPQLHAMITAVRAKGLVLIAAAGNDGPQAPPEYPAAYPEVIAVTATDVDDRLLNVANHGSYVSVAAPGVEIFVAAPGAGYTFTTGTSVATAHVSGLAALLLERNPRLTPQAVQDILMGTAKDLGPKGRDDEFGAGLVDAYEALLALGSATADRTSSR